MRVLLFLLFIGGLLTLARIYFKVRNLRDKPASDWDAKQIERLRLDGSDPFKAHDVDFFFAMSNESGATRLVDRLRAEGFEPNLMQMPAQLEHPFSVHAQKAIRLSVPEMQALSVRFNALAEELGGRYDGWAAAHVRRADDGGVRFRERQ